MKFCQDHWDRLRKAIDDRGLSDLIAPDGETAMAQMVDQLERANRGEQPDTPVNYDPLMSAHWAIVNSITGLIGPSMLYLMSGGDEDPEEPVDPTLYPNPGSRATWPRCPLCYVNLAHELTCTEDGCVLDKRHGYDQWIDRAADDELARVEQMRAQANT